MKQQLINSLAVAVLGISTGAHAQDAAIELESRSVPAKSTDEIARELANPNNSLASLTFKNQYRFYDGDIPGSASQDNFTLLFQPVFPFSLEPTSSGGKANLFVRPAFPILFEQPIIDPATGTWDSVTGLGDIGFDIGYGVTEPNGFLWAVGMVGTLPTATDSRIAGGQFRAGPEMLLAKFEEWGVYGIFPSHQWNVAGWRDGQFNTSQCQLFLISLPGGGWSVGSTPILSYDWKTNDWTIPLNLTVGKTVMFGNTPVKLQAEINYYIDRPDAFGSDWMIGFNVTPVIDNFVERWIRGN
ncbi:hypothetical protein HAHE_35650 [Haloferula helveola]|uniref:Neuromedin U n=1 Tax=Haloferula helveola TaxID=490095 RepID=A0ABM7RNU8_9BACT|nr:hypothetical protein HAHE_35650 [Haloferula helveola]